MEKKLLDLFQVLSQKEDRQEEHGVSSSTTDEAVKAATPLPTDTSQMVVYQSPATSSVKIMSDAEVEKAKFYPPSLKILPIYLKKNSKSMILVK